MSTQHVGVDQVGIDAAQHFVGVVHRPAHVIGAPLRLLSEGCGGLVIALPLHKGALPLQIVDVLHAVAQLLRHARKQVDFLLDLGERRNEGENFIFQRLDRAVGVCARNSAGVCFIELAVKFVVAPLPLRADAQVAQAVNFVLHGAGGTGRRRSQRPLDPHGALRLRPGHTDLAHPVIAGMRHRRWVEHLDRLAELAAHRIEVVIGNTRASHLVDAAIVIQVNVRGRFWADPREHAARQRGAADLVSGGSADGRHSAAQNLVVVRQHRLQVLRGLHQFVGRRL